MESFISNENKSILWGVLQENNAFQGIEDNRFKDVKKIFEDTIFKKKDDFNGSLIELNKETVAQLLKEINNFKQTSKISMIYKAEDFQNNRRDELNKKMKLQENDMNRMLNPDIPKEVSFSEVDVDKPLGDNLERAIADMMASRERELEQVPIDKDAAEKWINNGKSENKKTVSFDKDVVRTDVDKVSNTSKEEFNIFSKLKRKTENNNYNKQHDTISNTNLFKEILEIKQSINELKQMLIEKINN